MLFLVWSVGFFLFTYSGVVVADKKKKVDSSLLPFSSSISSVLHPPLLSPSSLIAAPCANPLPSSGRCQFIKSQITPLEFQSRGFKVSGSVVEGSSNRPGCFSSAGLRGKLQTLCRTERKRTATSRVIVHFETNSAVVGDLF